MLRYFIRLNKVLHSRCSLGTRNFLSAAYQMQDVWESRMKSPVLKNINLGDFYFSLDQKYQRDKVINPIDVDLFANALRDENYVDELEDLLHKLRLSPNASQILPSTSHAVIRNLFALGKHENLMRILDDRMNYGIFPDYYSACLLMDSYIKEKDFTNAARVATLQMLQEDWDDLSTTYLSLFSCHLYAFQENPKSWEEIPEPVEDDGEEIKIRVRYIRNPYFDDHFDLRSSKLLVGKTFAAIGKRFPDAIGRTYELIGWGMYEKFDKVLELLEKCATEKQKPSLFQEGVSKFKETLTVLSDEEGSPTKGIKSKVETLLQEITSLDLVTSDDLQQTLHNRIISVLKNDETEKISAQSLIYEEWQKIRQEIIDKHLSEMIKKKRLEAVEKKKKELSQREEELFYFENEEKYNLIIEEKEVLKAELLKSEAEKKKRKEQADENYIPPEVMKGPSYNN